MKPLPTFALVVLVTGAAMVGIPEAVDVAEAAERTKARARKSNGKAKPPKPRPAPAAEAPTAVDDQAAARTSEPPPAAAPAPTSASSSETSPDRPRPGRPRVYTFGGLDLEGKLKTPQLLYFRGRMRQELDASSLQRRSFLKELEKTADDQGL